MQYISLMIKKLKIIDMKNRLPFLSKLFFVVFIVISATASFSQTTTMSRQELALQKAEQKVETYRLKLVDIKIQIETADSLFDAGEKLEADSKIKRAEAKSEIKSIEKQYKVDSKPYNKAMKSKDRTAAAEARASLKEITMQYKADLKAAQTKLKAAEKGTVNAGRMMDKADKKLDMLTKKLKVAEKSYKDAEKALSEKKGKE
jgi:hypothetical protein